MGRFKNLKHGIVVAKYQNIIGYSIFVCMCVCIYIHDQNIM